MMNVTPELLSRYADGEVSPAEALAVEQAVASDPALRAELEEFRLVGELFGHIEPEDELSEELRDRLYGIRPAAELPAFEVVRVAAPRPRRWGSWVAVAAVLALCVIGYRTLVHKPEVRLYGYARMTVDASGEVMETRTHDELRRNAGDFLKAAPNERISFRLADGSWIYVMPGSTLELGDPRDGELFEVHRGTVLCTARRQEEGARVQAGAYYVHITEGAQFGVRIEGADVRPAGPAGLGQAEITVGVGQGSVEVGENGSRQRVDAYKRVVLRRGQPVAAAAVYDDPLYFHLMRYLRSESRVILPGYFTGERGVVPVSRRKWERAGLSRILTLTDDGAGLARVEHLVLYVRASKPGPLALTYTRPRASEPGVADDVTVLTPPVGTDWTVVSVPRSAFHGADAERKTRRISKARSRLVRFELRPVDPDSKFELKASLWAERPPVALPEALR